jgi:hypothetical protein
MKKYNGSSNIVCDKRKVRSLTVNMVEEVSDAPALSSQDALEAAEDAVSSLARLEGIALGIASRPSHVPQRAL